MEKLKTIMDDKNITATKLSDDLGISKTTITSYTRRRVKRIDIEIMIKIADYLGVTLDELFGRKTRRGKRVNKTRKTRKLSEDLMLGVRVKGGEIIHTHFTEQDNGSRVLDDTVVTHKVLEATHQHFNCIERKVSKVQHKSNNSYLFHTTDDSKAKRIMEILNEKS